MVVRFAQTILHLPQAGQFAAGRFVWFSIGASLQSARRSQFWFDGSIGTDVAIGTLRQSTEKKGSSQ
jgi:hypothetical protein